MADWNNAFGAIETPSDFASVNMVGEYYGDMLEDSADEDAFERQMAKRRERARAKQSRKVMKKHSNKMDQLLSLNFFRTPEVKFVEKKKKSDEEANREQEQMELERFVCGGGCLSVSFSLSLPLSLCVLRKVLGSSSPSLCPFAAAWFLLDNLQNKPGRRRKGKN